LTLEGRTIKSIVWGPKADSMHFHGCMSSEASKSERVRDGESARLLLEGTYCKESERFLLNENWKIDFTMSETSGHFET